MRAFVTGGTGFIGGRLVRRLRERGDEVAALVRSAGRRASWRRWAASSWRAICPRPTRSAGACRAVTRSSTSPPSTRSASRRPSATRCTRRTCAGPSGSGRRDRGEREADRLRLDGRRVRKHAREGRGRDLPAQRRDFLSWYEETKYRSHRLRSTDREGRADRDRAARRRLRAGRPLRGRRTSSTRPGPAS